VKAAELCLLAAPTPTLRAPFRQAERKSAFVHFLRLASSCFLLYYLVCGLTLAGPAIYQLLNGLPQIANMHYFRFGTPTDKPVRSTRCLKRARVHLFIGLILAAIICLLYGPRHFFELWQPAIFDRQYPPSVGYPCAFVYLFFSFFAFGALFWFLEAVRHGLIENAVVPVSLHGFLVVMALVFAALLTFIVVPLRFFQYLHHVLFA
jgi:hypothetical protein